jgi:hypothetical protein
VGIHETGDDDASADVDDFRLGRHGQAPTFADDASVRDDDVGVFDGRRRERHAVSRP